MRSNTNQLTSGSALKRNGHSKTSGSRFSDIKMKALSCVVSLLLVLGATSGARCPQKPNKKPDKPPEVLGITNSLENIFYYLI